MCYKSVSKDEIESLNYDSSQKNAWYLKKKIHLKFK